MDLGRMPLAMFSDSDDSESTELPTWKPSVIVSEDMFSRDYTIQHNTLK